MLSRSALENLLLLSSSWDPNQFIFGQNAQNGSRWGTRTGTEAFPYLWMRFVRVYWAAVCCFNNSSCRESVNMRSRSGMWVLSDMFPCQRSSEGFMTITSEDASQFANTCKRKPVQSMDWWDKTLSKWWKEWSVETKNPPPHMVLLLLWLGPVWLPMDLAHWYLLMMETTGWMQG